MDRRDFLSLAAVGGGAVFASSLAGCAARAGGKAGSAAGDYKDFYFVQLSDVHWGYQGPANPDSAVTLRKAVAAVPLSAPSPTRLRRRSVINVSGSIRTGQTPTHALHAVQDQRVSAWMMSSCRDGKAGLASAACGLRDNVINRFKSRTTFFGDSGLAVA